VETIQLLGESHPIIQLQWGHAFVSVETDGQRARRRVLAERFNGATLL